MTIIESALERAKSLQGDRSSTSTVSTASASVKRARTRATDATPSVQPRTEFQPHQVVVDPVVVRDNRLLFSSSVAQDRGAIAAYGMLRTRLLHRVRANGWTTVGVTSAAPQDGKSLTALNLSLSLARERNNLVALIDLDMRNPSVCRCLGIQPPTELRDYFEQKTHVPADLFMSIGVDNLIIAGNTTPTDNAAELLASARLEELLGFTRRALINPLILLDLPPLLSPEDALVVAPRIDCLLVVASEGITPISQINKALDLVKEFPLAGLVLNRSTEVDRRYAYGYGGYGQTK